jgi:hypothetical protein
MILRAEQVANAESLNKLKDAEIAALQTKLGLDGKKQTDAEQGAIGDNSQTAPIAEKAKKTGSGLSPEQISTLELELKAYPSVVKVLKGRKTPKLFAQQIQGAFNMGGWKLEITETADTQDWFILGSLDRTSSDTITQALEGAGIDYRSFEKNNPKGSMDFHLSVPED